MNSIEGLGRRFTRRDFIKGSLLCAASARVLSMSKEREQESKNFILFGTSTSVDIKNRLNKCEMKAEEGTWQLTIPEKHTSAYIHGKYGGKIDDIMSWLHNDKIHGVEAKSVFIMVGGNEITCPSTDEELLLEAERMGDVAKTAGTRFNKEKIHFILPFPTLLDSVNPDLCYEKRRCMFNNRTKEMLKIAKRTKPNVDNIPVELDKFIYVTDPENPNEKIVDTHAFRDPRHFKEHVLDKVIDALYEKMQSTV